MLSQPIEGSSKFDCVTRHLSIVFQGSLKHDLFVVSRNEYYRRYSIDTNIIIKQRTMVFSQ